MPAASCNLLDLTARDRRCSAATKRTIMGSHNDRKTETRISLESGGQEGGEAEVRIKLAHVLLRRAKRICADRARGGLDGNTRRRFMSER